MICRQFWGLEVSFVTTTLFRNIFIEDFIQCVKRKGFGEGCIVLYCMWYVFMEMEGGLFDGMGGLRVES